MYLRRKDKAANEFAMRIEFIPGSSATAGRFPVAGTSYTDGCAPGPRIELHSSCESCGAGFPRASVPVRKLQCVRPACPLNFRRRRLLDHQLESPKSEE